MWHLPDLGGSISNEEYSIALHDDRGSDKRDQHRTRHDSFRLETEQQQHRQQQANDRKRCCQSDANSSPLGKAIPCPALPSSHEVLPLSRCS